MSKYQPSYLTTHDLTNHVLISENIAVDHFVTHQLFMLNLSRYVKRIHVTTEWYTYLSPSPVVTILHTGLSLTAVVAVAVAVVVDKWPTATGVINTTRRDPSTHQMVDVLDVTMMVSLMGRITDKDHSIDQVSPICHHVYKWVNILYLFYRVFKKNNRFKILLLI